jgi:hypothetical protein
MIGASATAAATVMAMATVAAAMTIMAVVAAYGSGLAISR